MKQNTMVANHRTASWEVFRCAHINFRLIVLLLLISLLVSLMITLATAAPTHPFLLVKESDYPALQARTASQPWANMKTRAKNDVTNLNYDPSASISAKSDRMRDIVSAGALAYILDPVNKTAYKNKVVATLLNWDDLSSVLNCANWETVVRPGQAFFNSVLALDIIYNDLTADERVSIETKLQKVADWFWANSCSWVHNQYAVRGIWAIYQGDRTKIDIAKDDYKKAVLRYLTTEGLYVEGFGYEWSRFGSNNDAKTYFMDVLEYTGEDNTIYSDPQIKGMYEELYSSVTPFKQRITFGDTQPEFYPGTAGFDQPAAYRAYKFSTLAASNASWLDSVPNPPGRLLSYLFMNGPMAQPQKPVSRIWPSGLATFWENNASNRSLMAALWSPNLSEGHSHKDVDAVHLAAYGENILRNSGYAGWGNGCVGSSWTYLHDSAVSNNTVLIDGQDHVAKQGNGIVEGFTNRSLDYAKGDSGNALPNGKHLRNLLMVHPQDGVNGYFVLVDEVSVSSGLGNINLALHPSSSTYSVTSNLVEYQWTTNQYSNHNVYSNIFLATPPSTVTINDGALCTNTATYNSILGKYLYATYPPYSTPYPDLEKRNLVTIIFPSDDIHPKASMSRVAVSDGKSNPPATGARVNLNGTISDIILENPSPTKAVKYQGVSFKGIATFYRLASGVASTYFVKNGISFNNGQNIRKGFDSTANITIFLKEKIGNIVSPGTDVTFYFPGITGVLIDGSPVTIVKVGSGYVTASVPIGSHNVELMAQ